MRSPWLPGHALRSSRACASAMIG